MRLRPFFRYYGGKWMLARRYPAPRFSTIIEPFAGSAGYALHHADRRVILVERYPVVAGIWRYLIGVQASEILRIPLVDDIDDLPTGLPQEARWLVGMMMCVGAVRPRPRLSSRMLTRRRLGKTDGGWTSMLRARVAAQVEYIRHWRVIEGDYTAAPNIAATWFIDSPYVGRPGAVYVCGSSLINYAHLATWCRLRSGQVIVCEAEGANWLPFRTFSETTGVTGKSSREAVWIHDEVQPRNCRDEAPKIG